MKFSNGCWLNKEGYQFFHPTEVNDTRVTDKKVTLYAPCRKVNHRGDTLDGGMVTIELSSPMNDVIKVKAYHHKGAVNQGPHFEIHEDNDGAVMDDGEQELTFSSGSLKARVDKENWKLSFYHEDELLAQSDSRSMAYILSDEKQPFMREQLSLDVGELIYGLGERFTPFVKNGQTVDIWNEDGGTGSEQAYKNVPFYVSNKGYGVLINHPEKVSFEIGSEKVSKVQFSVEGEYLEYFIINGPTLKDVLSHYTKLTGRPSLPPAWSFGLWLSTSFTTNYDEETVTSFVEGMEQRDIPVDVFHFDCFWMKEFEWSNFIWDDRMFPDPEGMLRRLKDRGLKICVWINPYIAQKSELFDEGMEKGYLVKRADGSVWQWDKWQAGMGLVDFSNPEACKWYQDKLEVLIEMGVDSFKTDFGERIPTDVVYFDRSNPQKMHNYYTHLYNKTVFELLERKLGKNEAVVFARSATVGGQTFPVHWGGDSWSNYYSMAETLRGGLSFSLSGFAYWSHDISGFEAGATPDLYKRWTQFGLLSSHSRYHGSGEYKVPWLYGEEAVDVSRYFTQLKLRLMPYLFKNAAEASQAGTPMMRPMVLEFQDDPTCHYLDQQYMLGDSLLVAPILNDRSLANYYLPQGKWTNFITNHVVEGGKWVKEEHGYMTLPLMARENSIIVMGAEGKRASYDYTEDVTVHIFELQDNTPASADIYNIHGEKAAAVTAVKEGNRISVNAEGLSGSYQVVLRNIFEVESVSSGEVMRTEEGTLIRVDGEGFGVELIS
ncbi:alpha-xylosidase [Fictibacillus fluitans]|uniref:Alpha-xylosidase n=1 Tax=Fictibacillus fluitans TaxID=3058422 RepID=A0ABT8HTC2_9BACL|nr:alpha-xylosidase [Fictibacillus sp. NE201]MDN4523996.1 alpha-xylosidase [Fictibacillus sp. NE201]